VCGVLQMLKYCSADNAQRRTSVKRQLNLADSTTSFASRMEDNSSTDRVKDAGPVAAVAPTGPAAMLI